MTWICGLVAAQFRYAFARAVVAVGRHDDLIGVAALSKYAIVFERVETIVRDSLNAGKISVR